MRKIKFLIVITLLGSLIWYTFIKQSDYIVRFKANTSPGTVFASVENWNIINQKLDSFSYKITNKNAYTFINETIDIQGKSLDVDWSFESINDSVTQTIVGITEKDKSIFNRFTAPFFNTQFKTIAVTTISDFEKGLENVLKNKFKSKYIGIDTIPKIDYAYIEFKDIDMDSKAHEMMTYDVQFLQFLNSNHLKAKDLPFLIINKWNLNENTINFRYCFPIKLKDSMPFHEDIKFDVLKPQKALKAIYNGNYKTSDRGWFTLHEYAKRHHIIIENNPVEFFYNNPHEGKSEIEWKTEIFMPIKE